MYNQLQYNTSAKFLHDNFGVLVRQKKIIIKKALDFFVHFYYNRACDIPEKRG